MIDPIPTTRAFPRIQATPRHRGRRPQSTQSLAAFGSRLRCGPRSRRKRLLTRLCSRQAAGGRGHRAPSAEDTGESTAISTSRRGSSLPGGERRSWRRRHARLSRARRHPCEPSRRCRLLRPPVGARGATRGVRRGRHDRPGRSADRSLRVLISARPFETPRGLGRRVAWAGRTLFSGWPDYSPWRLRRAVKRRKSTLRPR